MPSCSRNSPISDAVIPARKYFKAWVSIVVVDDCDSISRESSCFYKSCGTRSIGKPPMRQPRQLPFKRFTYIILFYGLEIHSVTKKREFLKTDYLAEKQNVVDEKLVRLFGYHEVSRANSLRAQVAKPIPCCQANRICSRLTFLVRTGPHRFSSSRSC